MIIPFKNFVQEDPSSIHHDRIVLSKVVMKLCILKLCIHTPEWIPEVYVYRVNLNGNKFHVEITQQLGDFYFLITRLTYSKGQSIIIWLRVRVP